MRHSRVAPDVPFEDEEAPQARRCEPHRLLAIAVRTAALFLLFLLGLLTGLVLSEDDDDAVLVVEDALILTPLVATHGQFE